MIGYDLKPDGDNNYFRSLGEVKTNKYLNRFFAFYVRGQVKKPC